MVLRLLCLVVLRLVCLVVLRLVCLAVLTDGTLVLVIVVE